MKHDKKAADKAIGVWREKQEFIGDPVIDALNNSESFNALIDITKKEGNVYDRIQAWEIKESLQFLFESHQWNHIIKEVYSLEDIDDKAAYAISCSLHFYCTVRTTLPQLFT